ncbi:MAG: hypothetical protein KJ661_03360 [Candidatus Omnitrophica bacterium]|nr:hypothetical protein [Candidatus Omnitrophota bacterium]
MRYEIKKSFDRSVKGLPEDNRIEIKKIIFEVLDVLSTGKQSPKGIRLTRLRNDYWEIGTSLKERILFKLTNDLVQFLLVGNHDDIKRALKHL